MYCLKRDIWMTYYTGKLPRYLDNVMHWGIMHYLNETTERTEIQKGLHPCDCRNKSLHNFPRILYLVQRFAYSRDNEKPLCLNHFGAE